MTPKVQATKAKVDVWNCIKLKSLGTAKEAINRVKMQTLQWERYADYVSDKGLIFKICREFLITK